MNEDKWQESVSVLFNFQHNTEIVSTMFKIIVILNLLAFQISAGFIILQVQPEIVKSENNFLARLFEKNQEYMAEIGKQINALKESMKMYCHYIKVVKEEILKEINSVKIYFNRLYYDIVRKVQKMLTNVFDAEETRTVTEYLVKNRVKRHLSLERKDEETDEKEVTEPEFVKIKKTDKTFLTLYFDTVGFYMQKIQKQLTEVKDSFNRVFDKILRKVQEIVKNVSVC